MIRIHQNKKTKAIASENEDAELFETKVKSNRVVREKETCDETTAPKRALASSSALRILQSGANSSHMLREKLRRKGYSEEEIEEALREVTEAGLLDDRRLLFAHAEFLAARKFYGKRRVYMELTRKFGRNLVDACFEEAVEEIDFSSYCLTLAKKNATKGKEALAAKLSRQGYASSEIRLALSVLSEQEDNFT